MLEVYKTDVDLGKKLALVKDRASTLSEISQQIEFFYKAPTNIDWNIEQINTFKEKVNDIKNDIYDLISTLDESSTEWIQQEWVDGMKSIALKFGLKGGDSFMVLRMCIVGSPYSPSLFEAMQLIPKSEILKRIKPI